MAYYSSFDHCVATNLVLLCEEDTDASFVDVFDDDDDSAGRNSRRSREVESEPSLWLSSSQSDDVVRTMVERESEHLPRSDYLERLRSGRLDPRLRTEALDWIFKAHSHHSFGAMCICLAANYLDRFLSLYELPKGKAWTVQLLAVACLSIASKMEETDAPQTVDLQVGDPKFVFEAKTIQRMELLVLSTLQWRVKSLTPCSFIDHFLSKTIADRRLLQSMSTIFRSVQLILATIRGIVFLEFRPSEIAASVAILVSIEIKAFDFDKAMSSFIHLDKGRVLKCVELMKELSLNRSLCVSASSSTSIPQSPIGVLEASVILSYNNNNNNNTNNNGDINNSSTTVSSITTSQSNKKRKSDGFI